MLKMFKLAFAISKHTKQAADHYKNPLYKPVEVNIAEMPLDAQVLNVCHSLHNSAMYLLGTTDEVTALVLSHYFHKYLTDMEKIDDIKNNVQRGNEDFPWAT
jgi:hypothetical protein